MLFTRSRMSRRYIYQPRMTPRELSSAMNRLDLTTGQLARLTGIGIDRINRMLKGEDVPVHLQSTLWVWLQNPLAFAQAQGWANIHAHNVRDDSDA